MVRVMPLPCAQGFLKKCQISPDAFVQMALLLAYYRHCRPAWFPATCNMFARGVTTRPQLQGIRSAWSVQRGSTHASVLPRTVLFLARALNSLVDTPRCPDVSLRSQRRKDLSSPVSSRSEHVWTVTSDAVAFVKAMAHLDVSCAETKLHLLRRF